MIDSISGTSSSSNPRTTQATPQTSGLQRSPVVVNAIVQKQQKSSNATAPVLALAVPQTAKSGASSRIKVPRGSLIDVVA
ncbi:MAG: hypothetical protein WCD70_02535 [Alphaproteobacteria bacterium]